MDTLERQVELASQELGECRRKCSALERENATLMEQLRALKAIVDGTTSSDKKEEADAEAEAEAEKDVAMVEPVKMEVKVEEEEEEDEEEMEEEEKQGKEEGRRRGW